MVTGEDTAIPLVHEIGGGEVPAFHASGTPGGGPGMRGMHHAPPTQPPTPPTSQDIKQPPAHLPPQAHQMPTQSGGQMMQYSMPGTGRGGTQQPPFYSARAPPAGQRMAHARTVPVMSNSTQSFMTQSVVPPVYHQGHIMPTQISGQGPMFVTQPMNQPFPIQQPRHQSGSFYQTQQILLPQHTMFHYSQQPMYYTQSIQPMSRASGPAPNSQGGAPAQPQPSLALITSHGGAIISNSGASQPVKVTRPKKKLEVIDPKSGRNILDDINDTDNTSSKSGESSARQTPQPNAGQKTDDLVAIEFATRVAKAARSDRSGSPNSSLQQSSSRSSNYSENESQASPDPQGMSTPSVSPSKLDTSGENMSGESQIMENNITYDTNQQTSLLRGGWSPMPSTQGNVEMYPMTGMMIMDDVMRSGPLPNQPAREYQPPWISDGSQMSMMLNKETPTQMETSVRPGPGVTPVVSALAKGPTVDISPRPQREQFPALGKGHQQQSPVKRKQRSEQTQEQGEGKAKDQQSKPKPVTPSVEKKQQTQPSQNSDEYVQSVQSKNNEPKTIIIKKNESDSSGTKTKSTDSLNKNKESNNVEVRNLNEDVVQDNSRNKSENAVCEIPKENSPTPVSEEPTDKSVLEEVRENISSLAVSEPEVVPAPAEESAPNNEPMDEDAKSNNQKSKTGNKKPAQSKMRLESKEQKNAEPETPAVEVAPSAASVPETKYSSPSTVVINEIAEKVQEESTVNEEKEDLIVAAKNEENSKQATSIKTNDAIQAQANTNKVVLKHTYEVDQWSPLNPEGKKKYDRQFIMRLKDAPHSKRKPENLPNLELLNDNNKQRPSDRNVINSMNRSHVVDVMYPSFANKNSSQRGPAITKRGSQQGKPKPSKPAVMQVTLVQDVKLHETKNAWKPARNTEPANRTEEEAKTESLYKNVRGILNKLTPEKFEKLVAQIQALPIDNPTRLEGVIDLVFKKAVDEPSFSVAYAEMCSILQKMEVPSETKGPDGKPEPVNFRILLIARCQQEFEKNTAAELRRDERLQEIEQEKDPEKKKMLQLTFEEEERRIRMKSVGNIRFIGELYKMQMLASHIMYNCIKHLLNQGDEESLECLCKLLTTIGQGLEKKEKASKSSGKVGEELANYFKQLEDIVKKKGSGKVSSRVRFMIQDVIDLRNNDWVPRRNESQPKKMEQIQKEAERETIEMNLALNSPQDRNKRQDIRNSIDNRKRGGPDSAGWTTVTQQNKSRYVVERSKLRLDQSDVEVATNVSLGNRTQFIWGPGAYNDKADDKRSISQLGANKFALLSPGFGNSNLKGSSFPDKDRINSYKALDDEGKSYKSGNQQDSRSSSRESATSKRDDSRLVNLSNKSQVPPVQHSVPIDDLPEVDNDVILERTKRILEEYLVCLDVKETARDFEDGIPKNKITKFVADMCGEVMEKRGSSHNRRVGALMNYFINENKISKEQFLVGLSEVLETADDLALDMPLVWEYIAEILVDIFAEKVLTFSDLVRAMTPIRDYPGSAKLLASLLRLLYKSKGAAWLESYWTESEVHLSDMIGKENADNFVKQNNVEFIPQILPELNRLINAKASFDEITDWVTKNVGGKSSEPSFVRALMTILLEASVTKGQSPSSYKLDTEFLSHYEQLIVRYTNHEEKLELPCLFAVQAYVVKLDYPQALLHSIFNHLCDGGLIALESFRAWRDSKDPHEKKGHAVCVTSLTSFFTHLSETETDDEDSDRTKTNSTLLGFR